jgi:hypothetical protein
MTPDEIIEAVRSGEPVDLNGGELPADLLVELLTAPPPGRPRPVKISQARVTGTVDLEACALTAPLLLRDCHFDEPLNLDDASLLTLRLPGCRLPGLTAQQLRTTGNVELDDGFTCHGVIDLLGAQIGGKLSLTRAHLVNPGGFVLNGDRLTVGQGMFMRRTVTEGEARLVGARVAGQFDLTGTRLSEPSGTPLRANWITVARYMLCGGGFTTEGRIALASARIGHLDMRAATLANPGRQTLDGRGLTVEQDMVCTEGFTSEGEIILTGARIEGALRFDGAELRNPGRHVLTAVALRVDQSFYCRSGFVAEGELRLVGAHIAGVFDLTGATITNPGRRTIYGVRLTVDGDLFCRQGFTSEGTLQLSGAKVGGEFELDGATLTDPDGQALTGLELTVGGNMFCRGGFRADGVIHLVGAHIGGRLAFRGVLDNPQGLALDLELAEVGALILSPAQPPAGGIDLTNARAGAFHDDHTSWPSTMLLHGFVYDALEKDSVPVRTRLRWLASQPEGYAPQPYDQLADAYRGAGREEAARRAAIAKQWHRRKVLGVFGKAANWLFYLTVGYGYRTWLAAVWLAALLLAGTWGFSHATMTSTSPKGPAFHAFAYTLDLILPVIDLGQRKAWQPEGPAIYWSWALIAAGWLLTTAVVAALTRALKRT